MAEEKKQVNAWDLFRKTAQNLYDHITYTIGISLIWSVASAILFLAVVIFVHPVFGHRIKDLNGFFTLFFYTIIAGVLAGALVWGPVNCGLIHAARFVQENEGKMREFVVGFKRNYVLSSKVYALLVFGFIFLAGDILLAFSTRSIIMKIAGVSALYFLLFLLLMSFYVPGLIAFQEKNTVGKIFRKAYLLTLDNGLTNIVAFITLLVVCGLFLVLPMYVPFLSFLFLTFVMVYGGFLIFYQSNLYHAVIERYDD